MSKECYTCMGTGEVPDRSGNFPERPGIIAGPFVDMTECPDCNGTGCVDTEDE